MNIIGHTKEIDRLTRTAQSGQMPHAYLFSGIDGIGKRLVAKKIARLLLEMKDGREDHPELIEIEPENNLITIDTIREIQSRFRFSPIDSGHRVIIIDQAETMNANAANAALKILEEPPAGNHFFLITSMPERLLPTIVSRCQKIEFSPLSIDNVAEYLTEVKGYEGASAYSNAKISEGSIGRALSITPELIDSVSKDLLMALNCRKASELLDLAATWKANDNIENILYIIHRWHHDALINSKAGNASPLKESFAEIIEIIKRKNSPEKLLGKIDLIEKTYNQATKTYNKQLMFEELLFTLAG